MASPAMLKRCSSRRLNTPSSNQTYTLSTPIPKPDQTFVKEIKLWVYLHHEESLSMTYNTLIGYLSNENIGFLKAASFAKYENEVLLMTSIRLCDDFNLETMSKKMSEKLCCTCKIFE